MTTFAELKTDIAAMLQDPSNGTFTDTIIGDIVNTALAEIGRIAPLKFQENIDPVENTFEYTLQQNDFTGAVPEIEVYRVELWDETSTPHRPMGQIAPASQAYVNESSTGWSLRDGVLEIPYSIVTYIGSNTANYSIRVWGYVPYPELTADADVLTLSNERIYAMRTLCRIEAINRLLADRELFSQWQLRPGATDVSPAALLSAKRDAMEEWRRLSRSLAVLRETAG